MWFITFSTKHPICKKLLCLNWILIQVKTKALEFYLSQFCQGIWLFHSVNSHLWREKDIFAATDKVVLKIFFLQARQFTSVLRGFWWQPLHLQPFSRAHFLTKHITPSRTNPGRREKKLLHFYFHTSLWCLKRFYEGLKSLKFTGREGLTELASSFLLPIADWHFQCWKQKKSVGSLTSIKIIFWFECQNINSPQKKLICSRLLILKQQTWKCKRKCLVPVLEYTCCEYFWDIASNVATLVMHRLRHQIDFGIILKTPQPHL